MYEGKIYTHHCCSQYLCANSSLMEYFCQRDNQRFGTHHQSIAMLCFALASRSNRLPHILQGRTLILGIIIVQILPLCLVVYIIIVL